MSDIKIEFDYINEETYDLFTYFDCLHEGINNFLFSKAKQFNMEGLGTTHLAIDTNKNRIMGYFTLKNSSLLYSVNSGKSFRGMPSTEIYMFAIDKEYQGIKYDSKRNISDIILDYTIKKINRNRKEISASRFIILNSLEKSMSFYERNNFEDFNDFMYYLDDDKSINMTVKHPMYRRIGD